SESFHDLRVFLGNNGFEVTEVWLGDYISKDDDVRIPDVAKRMQAVLSEMLANGKLAAPFDVIVHSTGGLVVREWVSRYYPNGADRDGGRCPIKRIVMLSPANFGSRLAAAGKSFVGRVAKGFDNWFQTGTEMLRGLELASPYQWQLAQRDLLDAEGGGEGPYGGDKIWPFVIAGGRGYTKFFMRVANEDGADGTVRACAANMNCVGLTIEFSSSDGEPAVTPWRPRNGATLFPFAILQDRDHSTVHHPMEDTHAPEVQPLLGQLILEALSCDSSGRYGEIAAAWAEQTESVAALGLAENDSEREAMFTEDVPPREAFHQYFQVIVAAVDDQGQPVDDYFMEFYSPEDKNDDEAVYFQRSVLEHVHVNTIDPHFRCLYVDRTDLMLGYYPRIQPGEPHVVAMSLSAAPIGQNIRYFESDEEGASGHLIVHREDEDDREAMGVRLRRNMTHLVRIVIPRQPTEGVFGLSQP
ncbi:MAG: esterase/lipase family protein, partial [Propylenella sp.]